VYAINGNGQSIASRVASGVTMNTLPQVMSMPTLEEETTNTITVSWNSSSRSGVQYELWGDGDADGNFIKMENTIDHYRVFNEEMNWLEANEFCASLDA
jgi:hypothetical protein